MENGEGHSWTVQHIEARIELDQQLNRAQVVVPEPMMSALVDGYVALRRQLRSLYAPEPDLKEPLYSLADASRFETK
ncbi:hypothetical protein [Chelatococcus asaccharovorans]|uniref:Uncharacterized protein n=1 Tax=Chelatococcus asaccharovorans TaxID=28210 RepID=A0A2V3U5W6_9HYPH|nr:hypothetical protein [Chelatococcus asaccharovorans]MBS7703730.1 hypothetical protein [Chelatococcus asaccharovorans]PXW57888.1 hypothetical protein C7450_10660 [Chelatococcus asaccharovorans]